ncbi:MAG TPA: cyclic nucleotide-binding domain-containing protein [Acidimicrobiales bacterium]|nr:cyclic nucleotide-binding domain-containing protein [Acidimicrobiales bacterium]
MNVQDLKEVVRTHPMLAGLPEDVVELAAGCAHNVVFAEGALLFAEGDTADTLYLLRRGRVAIEVHTPAQAPLVIETVGAGDAVGWSWLIPPYRWRFDARAIEPVGAVALDGTCLRGKAEADPAFGYALLQQITAVILDRLQATRVRLLDLYEAPRGA